VKALLKVNVNKHLQDHESHCVMNLVQLIHKNEKERYQCSFYVAAESVLKHNTDRQYIIILLDDSNIKKQHEYTESLLKSECNKYSFRKSQSEMIITLYELIHSYCVPHIIKTVVILNRKDQFTYILTISD